MSWEIAVGMRWPKELVSGDFPARGQDAVDDNARCAELLREGWEPFAIVPVSEHVQMWFKREISNQESKP